MSCSSVNNSNPNCLNNISTIKLDVKNPVSISPQPNPILNSPITLVPYKNQLNAKRFGSHPPTFTKESNPVSDIWRTYADDVKVMWNGKRLSDKVWASGYAAYFGITNTLLTIPVGILATMGCGGKEPVRDAALDSSVPDQINPGDGAKMDITIDPDGGSDQIIRNESVDAQGNDPQLDISPDLTKDMYCSSTTFSLEKISDPSVKGPGTAIRCANINGSGNHVVWNPLSVNPKISSLGIFLYTRRTHQSEKISVREATGNCTIDDSGNKVAFAVRTGTPPHLGTDQVVNLYDVPSQSTQIYYYSESGNENDAPQLKSDGTTLAYYNFNYDPISSIPITMENIVAQNLITGGIQVSALENLSPIFLNINGNFLIYQDPGSGDLSRYDLVDDSTQPLDVTPTASFFSANDAGNLIAFTNGNNSPAGEPAQIFLFDATNNQLQTLEDVDGYLTAGPYISRNGRCVVWNSGVATDPDVNSKILVRDLSRGETKIINVNANGELTNKAAEFRDMDATCENLLYSTAATNLVDGCENVLNEQEGVLNLYVIGLNSFFSQP